MTIIDTIRQDEPEDDRNPEARLREMWTAEEATANARLIAAAPDLLLELETVVLRIELANAEGNPILSAWLPDAKKAIAKAKGE